MNISNHIRSFVRREGRMTSAQTQAFNTLWEVYGLPSDKPLTVLPHTLLEIGFGMGDSLLQQAKENPDKNYIGIEVHRPGVGRLLLQIQQNQINNIKIINHDAVSILKNIMPDHSLEKIQIFFPDPWPKKRHHKRRLIQPEFITLLHQKLMSGGILHIATDWEDYANHILNCFQQLQLFTLISDPHRPETKFEKRGKKLGHNIWDIAGIK